ncbi:hypothetical protein ACKKBG_A28445 [Auxenochlorella protothecoides x Auxenochlorella symbiontica]
MRNGSTGRAAALGVLGVVLLAVAAMGAVPTPISAWGPKAAFASVGVDQEAVTTLEALQALLSTGRSDGPLGKDTPIILYVSHSRDSGLEATLQPRLDSAEGWKQLPSASHAGGEGVIFDALQILAGQRRAHVVGSCQGLAPGAPATTAELQRLLAAPPSGDVVVVCAGEEAEQPALLNEVVRLSAESQPLMLVVELPAGEVAAQRRRLQAQYVSAPSLGFDKYARREGTKNYTVCDATCQRQTLYFEGFIVLIVIGMAVAVGLTCLHIIDTPTHLPSVKPGSGSHHHD